MRWGFACAALLATATACEGAPSAPEAASNLKVEYLSADLSVDGIPTINTLQPRFFWQPVHADRAQHQTAYRLQVNDTLAGTVFYDSGVVQSTESTHITFTGNQQLNSDTVYSWSVTWFDANSAQAPWAAPAVFATGAESAAWDNAGSQWIGCPDVSGGSPLAGSGYTQLRYEFSVAPAKPGVTVVQARAYVSGIGWYHAWLNGRHLGRAILEPAFTTLPSRVLYTAYDVGQMLNAAAGSTNVLSVLLGHGWPAVSQPWANSGTFGPIPWNGGGPNATVSFASAYDMKMLAVEAADAGHPLTWQHSGYPRRMRALLIVHYSDGSTATVVSSSSSSQASAPVAASPVWQCGMGALRNDSLYDGATIDWTQDTTGWQLPGYNFATGNWTNAIAADAPGGSMWATDFPPVAEMQTFAPQSMWESTPGNYVIDFGQNFAGYVRLILPAPTQAGWTVAVKHAESPLHPPYGPVNGSLYYGNLRSAQATDVHTTAGVSSGFEVLEPVFTWHGFRYCEIIGLPFAPTVDMVQGVHFRSAVATTGDLSVPPSANVINQLQRAIQWGQASNFMGNPSDCPQRDERLGWTGDSALSNEESALNFDVSAFYTHWAASLQDASFNTKDSTYPGVIGQVPAVVPDVTGGFNQDPAWKTVWPTTVYTLWKAYGDTSVPAAHWTGLMAFVNDTVSNIAAQGGIGKISATWGDWCPPPATVGGGQGPKPSIHYTGGIAFIADLQHLAELAQALGMSGDYTYLTTLLNSFTSSFNAFWLDASTGVYGNQGPSGLQTAQSTALGLGLVPASNTSAVVSQLVNDITGPLHAYHMGVGIIGMKYLHRALTANGYADLAVNITCQMDYPGFGFMFNNDLEPATTLWELWDGPFEGPGMNSRNHIMEGAVGAWLYTDLLGISQAFGSTAYSSIVIAPKVTTSPLLPSASGSYDSIRGTITVSWDNVTASSNGTQTGFTLLTSLPTNTEGSVTIPIEAGVAASAFTTSESGVTFFAKGAFIAGAVAGVTGAVFTPSTNGGLGSLQITVGSGLYEFAAAW